ncbi:peroxiredoxin [Aggregicoccus sp. 17bor-14]|uniref:peroxiredoxin n=1 Tax=Myxococcaceae TaxID=31 RepID=UPI00129CD8EF|nr:MULTISPECIES: peroxiredoxin [Myxococcaceae]MBF5045219.1 peroxiredoxin [Simulacricoccus sp. 17bor-14]MRI90960.1 peroxiredoxin [Aggregicoccus sp. 17bor-14]
MFPIAGLFSATTPREGDVVPDFTCTDTEGRTHTLSALLQAGPVVVAFFPKAFTPTCTRELKGYRDRHEELTRAHGQVLAVSMDDVETMRRFKQELGAPFTFVPDPEGELVRRFGVKMPLIPVPRRYTFVLGEGRRVLKVEAGKDAADPGGAIGACPLR